MKNIFLATLLLTIGSVESYAANVDMMGIVPVTLNGSELILVDATSGATTVNLPAAISNPGKVYEIKKIDSSTNAITIDPYATETVDGSTTTTLNTQFELLRLICDGTNWNISTRSYPQSWTSYTPTGSATTNSTYTGMWRRVGDSMEVDLKVAYSGAPNAFSTLSINLPTGYTIDTTKLAGSNSDRALGSVGGHNNGTIYLASVYYNNTTSVNIYGNYLAATPGQSAAQAISSTAPFTIGNGHYTYATFKVPITGWK